MKAKDHVKLYNVGDRFKDYFDRDVRIIGIVETYIVTRSKGAAPTLHPASFVTESISKGKLTKI